MVLSNPQQQKKVKSLIFFHSEFLPKKKRKDEKRNESEEGETNKEKHKSYLTEPAIILLYIRLHEQIYL